MFTCTPSIAKLLIEPNSTFPFEKNYDTGYAILRRNTQAQLYMKHVIDFDNLEWIPPPQDFPS